MALHAAPLKRRYFTGIGKLNEIFHVQNTLKMYFRGINKHIVYLFGNVIRPATLVVCNNICILILNEVFTCKMYVANVFLTHK